MQVNEEILDKEVRVIDDDGTTFGVIPFEQALALAISKNMDIVKIASNVIPPVCKIMDYGKSMFEQEKKEKALRKNHKVTALKEVRLSATIEDHDFNFKLKNASKFLQVGDKLKVSIKFRGREMKYIITGKDILIKFAEALSDVGLVEKEPKLEGRSMIMIINPKKL